MTKKPPTPAPATDEWGIYDPSKAGMQALYSRLGRPILRASAKSERRARRRETKADRPSDGVGLAIEEAKRRAGLIPAAVEAPPVPAQVAAAPPAPAPVETTTPVAPAPTAAATPTAKTPRAVRAKAAKTSKRKLSAAVSAAGARLDAANAKRAAARPAATAAPAPAPAPVASAPAARRATRKTTRAKPAAVAAAVEAPAVPSPSPRRPRGPVPLAAWAHAVSDASRPEPKRSEGKGLWRGIFRIPSEVALVEYARGCRIHRLVIEASSAPVDDPL